MTSWFLRLAYRLRGRRFVRLHMEERAGMPFSTMEGVLIGRVSGHYVLLLPRIVADVGDTTSVEGTAEVPCERVIFVQVLR